MGQLVNTGFMCLLPLIRLSYGKMLEFPYCTDMRDSTGVTLKKQKVADSDCPSVITHLFVQTHRLVLTGPKTTTPTGLWTLIISLCDGKKPPSLCLNQTFCLFKIPTTDHMWNLSSSLLTDDSNRLIVFALREAEHWFSKETGGIKIKVQTFIF